MDALLAYVAPVFQVADLTKAVNYYCECLTFGIEFIYEDVYASVVRQGCRIHLKQRPETHRSVEKDGDTIDACFVTSHIDAIAAQLSRHDAFITVPLRTMPYGREIYVKDLDGHVLAFTEHPARWQSTTL